MVSSQNSPYLLRAPRSHVLYVPAMTESKNQLDIDAAKQAIANFTVGFCKLSKLGEQVDAVPAGSGTLVTLRSAGGILTAAHVLQCLPNQGDVGLVNFSNLPSLDQMQKIDMALAEKVIIAPDKFGATGPDLGFLLLPQLDAQNLSATCNFLNIEKMSHAVRASEQPAPPYIDAVIGVVDEWTKDLPPKRPSNRRKEFPALFGDGEVISKYKVNGFDLCKFEISYPDSLKPPSSYGGMSGGGLWRIYYEADGNGRNLVREMRLLGVAFYAYQSDGKQHIICHGPCSVYRHLVNAVLER